MTDSGLLTVCKLEIEWVLTWFPVTGLSSLSAVKMRGGTINHDNSDSTMIYSVGQGSAEGDPIAPSAHDVFALLRVEVVGVEKLTFMVTIELANSSIRRSKQFLLEPNTITPFMINVPFREKDEVNGDTVATVQGVFTTSTPAGSFPFAASQSAVYPAEASQQG